MLLLEFQKYEYYIQQKLKVVRGFEPYLINWSVKWHYFNYQLKQHIVLGIFVLYLYVLLISKSISQNHKHNLQENI